MKYETKQFINFLEKNDIINDPNIKIGNDIKEWVINTWEKNIVSWYDANNNDFLEDKLEKLYENNITFSSFLNEVIEKINKENVRSKEEAATKYSKDDLSALCEDEACIKRINKYHGVLFKKMAKHEMVTMGAFLDELFSKNINLDEFFKKCVEVHNNRYRYWEILDRKENEPKKDHPYDDYRVNEGRVQSIYESLKSVAKDNNDGQVKITAQLTSKLIDTWFPFTKELYDNFNWGFISYKEFDQIIRGINTSMTNTQHSNKSYLTIPSKWWSSTTFEDHMKSSANASYLHYILEEEEFKNERNPYQLLNISKNLMISRKLRCNGCSFTFITDEKNGIYTNKTLLFDHETGDNDEFADKWLLEVEKQLSVTEKSRETLEDGSVKMKVVFNHYQELRHS